MSGTLPWLRPLLISGFALLLGLSVLLWQDFRRADRLSMRLRMVRQGAGSVEPESGEGLPPMLRIITRIGQFVARGGVLPTKTLEELAQTLQVAGFRGAHSLELFVGAKLLLVVGLPVTMLVVESLPRVRLPYPAAMLAIAGVIGLLAPDMIVRVLRKRYLRALEAGMPDAMDMMVICGQAGLGLEASVERVGIEIHHAHPVVAEELTRTAHEMQVNADTRIALVNFGKRTGLERASPVRDVDPVHSIWHAAHRRAADTLG